MMFLGKLGLTIAKFFGFFVLMTLVGQIPWRGATLEQRYHDVVNGPVVQPMLKPIHWAGEKVSQLLDSSALQKMTQTGADSIKSARSTLGQEQLDEMKSSVEQRSEQIRRAADFE